MTQLSWCTIANGLHKISDVSPCHAYSSTEVLGSCFRNLNELDSSVNNSTVNRKHPERLTNAVMSARGRAQYSSHLPGEFPTELQVIRGEWSLNPTGLQSPGKRKVPGSNPGRSLGHFYRSVIPHASRSLTCKHLLPLI